MTPQQHLKAALVRNEISHEPRTEYGDWIDDSYSSVEAVVLEAMRAHTNEVLGELEAWVSEIKKGERLPQNDMTREEKIVADSVVLGVDSTVDVIIAKIQSLKT